jgi:hypothetical protein
MSIRTYTFSVVTEGRSPAEAADALEQRLDALATVDGVIAVQTRSAALVEVDGVPLYENGGWPVVTVTATENAREQLLRWHYGPDWAEYAAEFDECHLTCPTCGGSVPNDETPGAYPGAISRSDNKTEICSACGTAEALANWAASR